MLSREALVAALPLTEQLDARGLFLQPIPGTPLAELVTATRSDVNFNIKLDGGGYSPDLSNIEYIANKQPTDGTANEHDLVMDRAVEVATKAVQKHVTFAKTVVAPAVEELVQRVNGALHAMTPSSLLGMEVKVYEVPSLLTNAGFEAAVRRFADTPYDNPRMNVAMPDLAASDIAALMAAGGAGLNKEINEWLATRGDSWLLSVWTHMFQIKPVGLNEAIRTFRDWVEDKDCGVDCAVAVFLLARRLLENVPEGVQMNLKALEAALGSYRNQAAARICRALDELALTEKAGTLVRRIVGTCTEVNGSVYRKFLEAGGSNEQLFGNMLSVRPLYTLKDISEQGAGLMAAWNRHAALTNTVEQGRKIVRTKELLASCFREQVEAVAEGDASMAGDRASVIRAFNEELSLTSEAELSNLYGAALRLLCRSRFCHTEAERILTGIEQIKRDNPQLDVREAAAVSVINYVAWWVAQQFKVTAL